LPGWSAGLLFALDLLSSGLCRALGVRRSSFGAGQENLNSTGIVRGFVDLDGSNGAASFSLFSLALSGVRTLPNREFPIAVFLGDFCLFFLISKSFW